MLPWKYVALNDWQIEEVKKTVAEAERGDFASDEDVEQTLTKWTRRAG
jgi:RHH-type transcriptional regulator, rel operon repressor / antitoxin RelB